MGIQAAKDVSKAYINDSVFLYLGGFIIALGIERWGLHRRIALHVVRVVGVGPRRIVLGFAIATGFLSMWISNTAAAMLMIPIAIALLHSLDELTPASGGREPTEKVDPNSRKLGAALMLAVAYSASIGGMTTLVGTPTNIAFRQIFATTFPDAPEVSAGQWMTSFIPMGAAMLLSMWVVLTFDLRPSPGVAMLGRSFFHERLRSLGTPSSAERRMFAIFAMTALLWLFRTPLSLSGDADAAPLVPGWGPIAASMLRSIGVPANTAEGMVTDSTVAVLMAVLTFFIPAGTSRAAIVERSDTEADAPGPMRCNLMDWPTANRLPWEVLLLFGGGFALADGFAASGLSKYVGNEFANAFGGQPAWVLVVATCLLLTFLTEFTSNTATCNIVLPILAPAAVRMGVDPRPIMVAATLSASCAFMLPVATPPNALVFGSGRVTVGEMARRGLALNLIGVLVVSAAVQWFYAPQAGIVADEVPEWARRVGAER
jgi:sodium-dependent dicarboxylate transporter 2/3/5